MLRRSLVVPWNRRLVSLLSVLTLVVSACAPAAPAPATSAPAAPTAAKPVAQPTATTAAAAAPTAAKPTAAPTTAAAKPTAAAQPTTAPAAAAGTGGTLRAAFVEQPQGFDPALATIGASHQVIDLVYSKLVKLDPETKVAPDLAKSWQVSPDGKTYTFTLRDDAFFHNGQPVTADDVVFTFKRLIDPKTGYSYITQMESIQDVIAVDKSTVKMVLSQPTGPLLTFLAFPGSSIVPKSIAEVSGNTLNTQPVGSGPFKFIAFEPGTRLVLEANTKYYEPGKPKLGRLEMVYIADETERTTALLGGTVDFATFVGPKDYDRIVATPGFKGSERLGGRWYWIMIQTEKAPLNSAPVRQAISLALDRQALADALFFGHAKPMLGGPIPEWSWGFAKDLESTPAKGDPEKAKKLLADAGFGSGLKLTMTLGSAWQNLVNQGPLIKDMLGKVGIEAELTTMENPRYLELVWSGAQYELSNMFWLSPLADPDDFMYLNYKCGSPMNPQKYCNQELDALLQQARYTTDQKQRADLYHKAEQLVGTEMPLIPTVFATNLDAFSDKVKGFQPMRTGMYATFDDVTVDK